MDAIEKIAAKALRDAERAEKKAQKEAEKLARAAERAKPKSEEELIMEQAARMRHDMHRLQLTNNQSADKKTERSSVDIWKDTDFFFSVVFQSSAQKYEFMEQFSKMFKLGIDNVKSGEEVVQVFNGMKLAENLGIKINSEKLHEYPYPDLELRDLTLDNDIF